MDDLKWDNLTVNELRQILTDSDISCPANVYKKKSQLVQLCHTVFGDGNNLYDALNRYNKLGKHKLNSRSKTPGRMKQPSRRLSAALTHHDVSTSYPDYKEPDTLHPRATTPPLRRGRVRNSVTPVRNSAFRSLAASEEALREFQGGLLQKQQTPLRSDPFITQSTQKNPELRSAQDSIIRAGRFSLPSDDIILSPTYHTANSPSSYSNRNLSPKNLEISSKRPNRDETPPRTHMYNWPALDPQGNPIRWRIRDPFVFNLESPKRNNKTDENNNIKRSVIDHKLENKWRAKHIPHFFSKFFIFLIVFTLVPIWYPSIFIPLWSSMIRLHKTYRTIKPFCNNRTEISTPIDCVPCPENSICNGMHFECQRPQYRKEKHRGQWICVKDQKIYRQAHVLLKKISSILAEVQGNVSCGGLIPNDALMLNRTEIKSQLLTPDRSIWIGFTRIALENRLNSIYNLSKTPKDRQLLYQLVFTEVFRTFHNTLYNEIGSIRIPDTNALSPINNTSTTTIYFTRRQKLPWKCLLKRISIKYGSMLIPFLIAFIYIYRRYTSAHHRKMLHNAVSRIITENTLIQKLPGGKGYAIGPRASDIHHILLYGKAPEFSTMSLQSVQYPEYTGQPFTKHLDLQRVQNICEDLVKRNADFCRSILYVDRIPFYFNKRVIDISRMNAQSETQKPSPVPF